MKSPSRRTIYIGAALFVVAILGGWALSSVSRRAGRNDLLLREARFLQAALYPFTNAPTQFAGFPIHHVNGKAGAIIPINEDLIVDDQQHFAVVGWTNSCLGCGTLMVTRDGVFLWRSTDGATRKLRIPNLDDVPIYWYFTCPFEGGETRGRPQQTSQIESNHVFDGSEGALQSPSAGSSAKK
jgi:hypothetical protein